MIRFLLVTSVFILSAVAGAQGSIPISQTSVDRMLIGLEQEYERGYELGRLGALQVALLRERGTARDTFGVVQGRSYRFVAVGEKGTRDIALELDLVTEIGRVREYKTGPIAEIEFTAKKTGAVTASVTLSSADSSTTSYDVSLLAVEKVSAPRTAVATVKWMNTERPKILRAFSATGAASVLRPIAPGTVSGQPTPWYCILVDLPTGAENNSFFPQLFGRKSRVLLGAEPGARIELSLRKKADDASTKFATSAVGNSAVLPIPASTSDSVTLLLSNKSFRSYVAMYILADPDDPPTTTSTSSPSKVSPENFTSRLRWGRTPTLKLLSQLQRHYREGYEMGVFGSLQTAFLGVGQSAREEFRLVAGRQYRIVATGGVTAADVDVYVESTSGVVIAADAKLSADAEVTFVAPTSGLHIVRVKLHKQKAGANKREDVSILALERTISIYRTEAAAAAWFDLEIARIQSAFDGVAMEDVSTLRCPEQSWYNIITLVPNGYRTTFLAQKLLADLRVRVGAESGGSVVASLLLGGKEPPYVSSGLGKRSAEVNSDVSGDSIQVRLSNAGPGTAYIVTYIYYAK